MNPLWILLAFVLVSRLVAAVFDRGRIESYLRDQGGTLISKKWDPFGPGCRAVGMRIYKIVYRDSDGFVCRAHVKTSMAGGVYFTGNRVVEDPPDLSVEEEKARLRRRLAELEGQ